MIDLFFSYSHRDEVLRDELEIHLAMLKRQGLLRAWHDRRIPAGQEVDREISQHLEQADVILLLLSPYFLASDYCYELEASRALQRQESGAAIVIPVILEPCDWQNSPFRRLRASPTDGKPVTKFPNIHDAFLEVTQDIRQAAEALGKAEAIRANIHESTAAHAPGVRSSNLRLKKTFTDRDKDMFLDEAFSYIKKFFENSLVELSARNPGVEHRFRVTDDTVFTAAIYVKGEKRTSCRIWLPGRHAFGADIAYSANDSAGSNSLNDSMNVDDDGYQPGLKPMGMSILGSRDDQILTPHGAAEYFWTVLISRLQ